MPETTKRLPLCDQMMLAAMRPDDAPGHKGQTRRTGGLKAVNQAPDDWTFVGFDYALRHVAVFAHRDKAMPIVRIRAPYAVGGRVALTEAFRVVVTDYNGVLVGRRRECAGNALAPVEYRCDGAVKWRRLPESHFDAPAAQPRATWLAPRYMPLWAAREFRVITRVRCERVAGITWDNACAEGWPGPQSDCDEYEGAIEWFHWLWDKLHGAGAWDRNEWTFPYSFKREEAESDA